MKIKITLASLVSIVVIMAVVIWQQALYTSRLLAYGEEMRAYGDELVSIKEAKESVIEAQEEYLTEAERVVKELEWEVEVLKDFFEGRIIIEVAEKGQEGTN